MSKPATFAPTSRLPEWYPKMIAEWTRQGFIVLGDYFYGDDNIVIRRADGVEMAVKRADVDPG